jgi:hypothetical protein
MLCKAWTVRRLVRVCSAPGTIFNNMLYVRYVHLTKGQSYSYETHSSSPQRVGYTRTMNARVKLQKKKSLVVSLKGLGAKTN